MAEQPVEPRGDNPDQWSKPIAAAHPMKTGDHGTYATAMEMVGNRHSKAALVGLVNWLLKERGPANPSRGGETL